jgi:hypothetical protein
MIDVNLRIALARERSACHVPLCAEVPTSFRELSKEIDDEERFCTKQAARDSATG